MQRRRQENYGILRYPLSRESNDTILYVATTRPETMLGDVAVAVNPDDDRYQAFDRKTHVNYR